MAVEAYNSVIHILTFKRGATFWVAALLSMVLMPSVYAYAGVFDSRHDDGIAMVLLQDTNTKDLLTPILADLIGTSFYILFNILDLITGLQASKWENSQKAKPVKKWIQPERLYKTLWKVVGVLFLTGFFTVSAILMEVLKSGSIFFWVCLWSLVVFWVMAVGFEFYSCGENLERRYGQKPAIFGFWDKILGAFEKKAIDKIDSL